MLPLIIGLLLITAGLGAVAWLMWNENKETAAKEPESEPAPQETTGPKTPKVKEAKPEITPAALLKNLGLEEERTSSPIPEKKGPISKLLAPLFSKLSALSKRSNKPELVIPTLQPTKLPEEFNRVSTKNNPGSSLGTASLRLDQGTLSSPPPLPPSYPTGLAAESDWAFKYEELQKERDSIKERFERLDSLFKEKGDAFDKSEKALANEVKNRKEFNKVKDILEKELKDSKDKNRELEIMVTSSQTESGAYLKRVNQLEEKIKKLEKDVLEKEGEMKEAQGQIQGRQKMIADLEEKITSQEKVITEKKQRIDEIVSHIKPEGKPAEMNAGEGPEKPAEDVSVTVSSPEAAPPEAPEAAPEPTPAPPTETAASAASEPTPPPNAPEPTTAAPPQTPVETAAPVETRPEAPPEFSKENIATAAPEPALEQPSAEPEPPKEEKSNPPERGNIILQALEKEQSSPPEPNPSQTETAALEPTATAEPTTTAPQETPEPINNEKTDNPPPIKLAPDILEEKPKEIAESTPESGVGPNNPPSAPPDQSSPEKTEPTT